MVLEEVLANLRPSPASYLSAARRIGSANLKGLRNINVAFLSTFTSELLRPYLAVESALRGVSVNLHFSPFDQIEQQVLDHSSLLYKFNPDVVIIAMRIEDIAPALFHRFLLLAPDEMEIVLSDVEKRIKKLVDRLRYLTTAKVFVFNFPEPVSLAAGIADSALERSQSQTIYRANERVARICWESPDTYVFDCARVAHEVGLRHWFDAKLWYMARIPYSATAQREIGRHLARCLRASCFPSAKCLVVDLDNTLWKGVLGEEGLGGIGLGENYPGSIYKEFQRTLLSLRDRGILLAIASKNNEDDVLEVFERHPDCVLRIEDFATHQIHWKDKATSLVAIARELRIGTDALVFFDDSPVEREWIRAKMPEVKVIDVPNDPSRFTFALAESGVFDSLQTSTEDRKRAEMYQGEKKRQQIQKHSTSLEDFLEQLEIVATIGYANKETVPRMVQLIAKTNQFNLTTRRHGAARLQDMMQSGAVALWLRVTDRFGDNGLVGAAIAVPGPSGVWTIDTFLLSCRVIGRQVENVLLRALSRGVRTNGGRTLVGEYVPTAKNSLVAQFYPNHGFDPVGDSGENWKRDLLVGEIASPKFIEVRFQDDTSD